MEPAHLASPDSSPSAMDCLVSKIAAGGSMHHLICKVVGTEIAKQHAPSGSHSEFVAIALLLTLTLCTSRLHVVLTFLLIEFALLLSRGVLILLILRHEIVHVGLSLGEFHFVHALASVPVKEGLTTKHRCEVFSNTLEHLLDRCGIPGERNRHFQ